MSRAIVFTNYGEPEVLQIIEVPSVAPKSGEVRVRVRAAGVQPFDALFRSGAAQRWVPAKFPQRLGNEWAGTIDAIGDGVSTFSVGDEVLGWAMLTAYGEHVVVGVDSKIEAKPHHETDAASKLAMEIANRWTSAFSRGDIDELLALYHPDAVLETPVTFALNAEPFGILRGPAELRELFTSVAQRVPLPKASLRRLPLSDGRLFVWEFHHDDETTDKNEFVEVMELEDCLIRCHRFIGDGKPSV